MTDEPRGLIATLWRASLAVLGSSLALWLSVRLLLQIWWVLAILAALVAVAAGLFQWWRSRGW